MKRMIALVLCVLLAVGMFAGCAAEETAQQPQQTADAQPAADNTAEAPVAEAPSEAGSPYAGEITVYAWTEMATALGNTAARFMEQHPEATITVEQVDGSYTKLLPELASGIGVPDVFMVQNTDIMSFVYTYEGQILDVTDLVEGEVGNFVDSAIATCYNKADGKYYGIPIDIGPCALMYRTDIFEQAGIDVNSIKTWDDYIEAGKKILEATNGEVRMTGFNMNGATSTDYMKMLFAQQGGSYYNEDGTANLASEEMINAANMLNKMIDAGIILDLPDEWNDRVTALVNTQICTLPYPEWYSICMPDYVGEQKGLWAYAPMPSFDGSEGDCCLGGSVLAISANTAYPELAKAFVKFSLMDVNQADLLYAQGQYEAYKLYYDAPCYSEVNDYFGIALGTTFAEWTDAPAIEFGAYFTDISAALSTAIGEMFINGVAPKIALAEATETANRAIASKQ